PFTSVSTFDLLMSSLMMVLALAAVQRGDLKWGKIWLFSTALLGLVILGGQVLEFTKFVHKGLTIGTNLFGCTFFVLTGTHGAPDGGGVSARGGGAGDSHRARGAGVLRPRVPRRARAGLAGAVGGEVHLGGHVLHAPEGRQQVLHLLVRRPAGDRGRGDGGSAVPVPGSTDAQGGRRSGMIMPAPWQRWDWHASVVSGLALLGGLYAYLGGLAAPRRRVLAFGAALGVLGVSLNGPLHNLSDGCLFSAHMVQHLVLTLVFPPLLL